MYYFVFQWALLLIGLALHLALDRSPAKRTTPRVLELVALWFVVVGIGVNGVLAGLVHTGPGAGSAAAGIGFLPTPFQWEVGVSDLAVGLAAIASSRPRFRGSWMSAVIVIAFVQLGGDGVGHLMQYVAHDNTAPNNLLSIPTCFLVPVIAGLTTLAHRRAVRRTHSPGAHAAERGSADRVPA